MKAPVFVKVEDYKEITETISQIKGKLEEAKAVLQKMHDAKKQEEQELKKWNDEIESAEQRLQSISLQLANPEQ